MRSVPAHGAIDPGRRSRRDGDSGARNATRNLVLRGACVGFESTPKPLQFYIMTEHINDKRQTAVLTELRTDMIRIVNTATAHDIPRREGDGSSENTRIPATRYRCVQCCVEAAASTISLALGSVASPSRACCLPRCYGVISHGTTLAYASNVPG